jgi:transcriptional regulator with XRE-family HTH domain
MAKGLGRTRHWVSSTAYRAAINVIIAARHESGLSQKAIAEALGKPPSLIAKIELGERRLDLVEFIAIARAVGVMPSELFERVEAAMPGELDI